MIINDQMKSHATSGNSYKQQVLASAARFFEMLKSEVYLVFLKKKIVLQQEIVCGIRIWRVDMYAHRGIAVMISIL